MPSPSPLVIALAVALPLIGGSIAPAAAADPPYSPAFERMDPTNPSAPRTSRRGVRACPPGFAVSGIRVDRNELLCLQLPVADSNFAPGGERLQTPAASSASTAVQVWPRNAADVAAVGGYTGPALHWCGPDGYLTGLDAAANQFLCGSFVRNQISPSQSRITSLAVDRAPALTVRADMHACPAGSVVVGYHDAQNILLCGRLYAARPPSSPAPPPQRTAVPVTAPGDRTLEVINEACGRPTVEVAGHMNADIRVPRGGAMATVPGDQRNDPGELNIRWYCTEPGDRAAEWVDCPRGTTVLGVARPGGRTVTFTCIQRAGVPDPNR